MNREYAVAVGAVAACTAVCFVLFPFLAPTNLAMIYLAGVLIVARRGCRGPAVLFSALGVLAFDFFFIPPRFSFAVSDTQYLFTFLVMFAVALVITDLTIRTRAKAESAESNERRTASIHGLTRRLADAPDLGAALKSAAQHIADAFEAHVAVLVPGSGRLEIAAQSRGDEGLDDKSLSVAQSVLDSGRAAGLGTDSLAAVGSLFLPLRGAQKPVGVLRLKPIDRDRAFGPDPMHLLEAFAHQIGLAMEVERLQENARRASLEAEKERLRSSLLSSVSHDLRTPLAAIIGSASSLLRSHGSLEDKSSRELLENIQEEGERLSRLVHNLIETTRLESGAIRLRKEPYSIEELVGAALERLEKPLSGRKLLTRLPEELPLVPLDSVLMEQVFVNLIDNAARHTPPRTPIEISAGVGAGEIEVRVSDRGPGLSSDELERVFEKFYHAKKASSTGVGLGLAICRAVVEAHNGRIWADNRPEGGAVFRFTLPTQ